jgi:membrane protease YdiL (CAAX protease family)
MVKFKLRPPVTPESRRPLLLPFLALLLLTLLTQLGSVAYDEWAAAQLPDAPERSLQSTLIVGVIFLCVVTIPLAGLGLLLGGRLGLGAPLLTDLLQRRAGAAARLHKDALLAIPLGFGTGVILLLMRMASAPYLPPELPAFGHRGALAGLLLSAGAAVGEETWIRLGVMTLLVWSVARLLGHSETRPMVIWSANIFAALVFGLIHLPQLAQFDAATPNAIAATLLGNGIVGVVCGWLYWRRSLIAAILAHFAVDLILHVLTAIRF